MNHTSNLKRVEKVFTVHAASNAVVFVVDAIQKVKLDLVKIANFIYAVVVDKLKKLFLNVQLSRMHASDEGGTFWTNFAWTTVVQAF